MKMPSAGPVANSDQGEKKVINSELWHACAGPLVSLPPVGSIVVYFPQGHSEQVAASMQKGVDGIPSYPNLPSKLICMLHNVTLHADPETDEVYAQMTLQPVNKYDQEALLVSEFGLKHSRQPAEFFCKTLTASDTSTHGGFSVPRRAAEKIFPPLNFSMQPPAQELTARDLHNQAWTFRHIYRGQPKRHLLTTGWSVFISSKRLVAGDAVLFIRDEKSQLFLGIRRANRQQPSLSSSVISSESMHIGVLAAAAQAAANNSPFTIFYNPRASPSEFVIPVAKYNKAMYTQISPGMRFRMMFETEESGVRRYMGTVTGVGDLDPVRWKNSQWRNLQVGWDESTAGDRPSRVSIWEIEPVVTPFYICPPSYFRPKYPKLPGFPDDDTDMESLFKRGMPWIADDFGLDASSSIFPGLSLVQWLSMQQNQHISANNQTGLLHPNMISSTSLPLNLLVNHDDRSKLLNFQNPAVSNLPFAKTNQQNQLQPSWPQQLQVTQQVSQSAGLNAQQSHNQARVIHQSQPVVQQSTNHKSQQTPAYSHIQQPNDHSVNKAGFPVSSMTQDMVFQKPVEEEQLSILQRTQQQQQLHIQQSLGHRPQIQQTTLQQSLSEQQLQLQLLQKLQQQMPPSLNPTLEPQFIDNQQALLNQTKQSFSLPPQQLNGGSFTASAAVLQPSSQYPVNQLQCPQVSSTMVNVHSGHAVVDAPSCSTSSPQIPRNFLRNQMGPATLPESSFIHQHPPNTMQEAYIKPDVQTKHETHKYKTAEQPKFKNSLADHLDASSSATSYCLDTNGPLQNFPGPGLDGDVQSHATRNGPPFMSGIDEPDALLSRGYDSDKDIQNLLSNYNGDTRDTETDLSPGINSEVFGLPSVSFKPGFSNDAAMNETGVPNGGLWPNQGQRMRTYTKVQKRGSVGRTIDVTRYKGYDELRHDLACMFGIEGLLEDPRRTEWKLVYVDHENDILLVGDDPWEEFVSCVQSIKILSAAEVQQMSLDGDLCQLPVQNQACSGADSGNNLWRGHYDDNSATSFHR